MPLTETLHTWSHNRCCKPQLAHAETDSGRAWTQGIQRLWWLWVLRLHKVHKFWPVDGYTGAISRAFAADSIGGHGTGAPQQVRLSLPLSIRAATRFFPAGHLITIPTLLKSTFAKRVMSCRYLVKRWAHVCCCSTLWSISTSWPAMWSRHVMTPSMR